MKKNRPIKIKTYGWKPDLPDHRDHILTLSPSIQAKAIPTKVDLRPNCPAVYDQGDLGSCHDPETEVLTENGWKKFENVIEGEKLASVDPETNKLIFEKPIRLVKFNYEGKMFYGKHQNLDFAVTSDHEMLVKKWNQFDRTIDSDFSLIKMQNVGWYVGLMNQVDYKGEKDSEYYILPGVEHKLKSQREDKYVSMNSWLKFIGIYLAEGTMCKYKKIKINKKGEYKENLQYKIQIVAVKPREREFVKLILQELGLNFCELKDRFTFQNKQIYKEMEKLGLKSIKSYDKFVPEFVFKLDGKRIKNLLLGHFYGDGCEQKGFKSHYTSSSRLANDLQILMLLSGSWSCIRTREPRISKTKDGKIIIGKHIEHRLGVSENKNLSLNKKTHVTIKEYNGLVYCAEVPTYHTLITRRNGKMLISGNCTAQALGGLVEFEFKKLKKASFTPSRLFIYYNERVIERTVSIDAGASIRDGMKVLNKQGAPHETLCPYVVRNFAKKPSTATYIDGLKHLVTRYQRVDNTNLGLMKSVLSGGDPIVGGFTVFESFESDEVAATGIVPMPSMDEYVLGGHAIMVVGYDDANSWFIVRNSWGRSWGAQGYFYMPYDYFTNPYLADDFWTASFVN